MPEHRTIVSESSSSPTLPTPDAYSANRGGSQNPTKRRAGGHQVTLADETEKGKEVTLLPTPVTTDAAGARNATANRSNPDSRHHSGTTLTDALLPTPSVAHLRNHDEDIDGYLERRQDFIDGKTLGMPGASLGVAVRMQAEGIDLLPTTSARDFKDGQANHERNGKVQTDTVARQIFSGGEITSTAWGKFAPAIERWEQLTGRAAPAPTKPDGKDDAHRLSSEFTEWMMGLPAGWITGVGLSRNEELKACGNGVVPQQAELALRMLLEGLPVERERERERTVMLPTPTVSDIYTGDLASTQQKPGSMHSVTLPQAVRMVDGVE